MGNENTDIVDAQIAVVDAVNNAVAEATETADDIAIAAIEAAEANIDEAQRAAEQIAEAAMMTHLGTEIQKLKEENYQWQNVVQEMQAQFQSLNSQLAEMTGQISSLAVLEVTSSQSIPQQLQTEVTEATQEIAEILPESLADAVAESPVVPEPPKAKRGRWI